MTEPERYRRRCERVHAGKPPVDVEKTESQWFRFASELRGIFAETESNDVREDADELEDPHIRG